ncbi:MAG: hypothetical protein ABSD38_15105 [Syntrophorhabdales bacterium]
MAISLAVAKFDRNKREITNLKEVKMRKVQTIVVVVGLFVLIAGLLFPLAAAAEDKQPPKVMNKIEPLPRDLEIQLALSALPPHLRDNATVYVLNPDKGFEVARKGTNPKNAIAFNEPFTRILLSQ